MNDVQLIGLKEVMKKFDFYDKDTRKRLRGAVKDAAKPVLADAKSKLQAQLEDTSGLLEKDLTIIAEKSKGNNEKYVVRVGQQRRKNAKAINQSGTPYGGYVEYGTSKTAAKPFLRPAIEENGDAVKTAVIEGILNEFLK